MRVGFAVKSVGGDVGMFVGARVGLSVSPKRVGDLDGDCVG